MLYGISYFAGSKFFQINRRLKTICLYPLVEKTARVEIEFEGSLDQYLVNFGIHSLSKGVSGFVNASIVQPGELEWTQVIAQANTFNLSTPLSFSKLIVESGEPVHTFGFIFNAVHTGIFPMRISWI